MSGWSMFRVPIVYIITISGLSMMVKPPQTTIFDVQTTFSHHLEVSLNNATPKSSIVIGCNRMFHYIPAIGVAHPSDPSCFTERGMPRGTQMHTEKYSSSDVGHTGHGIREAQHAYSNSTSGVAPWPSGSHVGGCETWADFRKTTGDLAMEHGH